MDFRRILLFTLIVLGSTSSASAQLAGKLYLEEH